MKIAGIQMDIALGQPDVNRRRVEELIRQAAGRGAEVMVLPEMWNTGYCLDSLDGVSDLESEPSVGLLGALAKELQVDIIGGSVSNKVGKGFYNSALVLNREGAFVHRYDKMHLFGLMKEDRYLTAGDRAQTFELGGARWGLIICYDLRFPELARVLAVEGAQILAVPAQWPKARLAHWRSLLIARAIENQQYVVAVNRVGADTENVFGGHSLVVDPLGEVLAETGEEEQIFLTEIDLRKVAEVRRAIPVLKDRRLAVLPLP